MVATPSCVIEDSWMLRAHHRLAVMFTWENVMMSQVHEQMILQCGEAEESVSLTYGKNSRLRWLGPAGWWVLPLGSGVEKLYLA